MGDPLTGLSLLAGAIALAVAWQAKHHARRSADAAERSAAAALDTAAEMRRENDRNEAHDREARNARLREALSIKESGGEFRFVLAGHEVMAGVRVIDPPPVLGGVPQGFDLGPDRAAVGPL